MAIRRIPGLLAGLSIIVAVTLVTVPATAASYIYTTIDDPAALPGTTSARAINDQDQVVGNFQDASGDHGFLDTAGVYTTFDDTDAPPGTTWATGINDKDQVIGYFQYAIGGHLISAGSYLETAGVYTALNDPMADVGTTNLAGINDAGRVVGSFEDATGWHGLVETGGVFTSVDDPAGQYTFVSGINSGGQIVGWIQTAAGYNYGFIATPVPEAGSWTMLLAGIGAIGATVRSRRRGATASG